MEKTFPRNGRRKLGLLIDFTLTFVSVVIGVTGLYCIAILAWHGIIDAESLTFFLAMACALVTMLQYVAAAPLVKEAVQTNNAQRLPIQVFVSQAACNVLGASYGIQIINSAVLITNMFGLGCQLTFLVTNHYIVASNERWLLFAFVYTVIFNSGLTICSAVLPIRLLGHAITVFNIYLYAAPLGKVAEILRTKNSAPLDTMMTGIAVVNNALWSLYALMIQDSVLLVPSVLGYMLSAFQVLVILWCRGNLPYDLAYLLNVCGSTVVHPSSPSRLPATKVGRGYYDRGREDVGMAVAG